MSTSNGASRSFPFLSEFPARQRQLAEKTAASRDERLRKASDTLGQKAERIKEAGRRQIYDLVGAKNWATLRQFMQRERLAFRDLLQPPRGLRLDRGKAIDARVKKGDLFLRKLGGQPSRLRAIGRETQAQLQELLPVAGKVIPGHHLPQHLETWKKLSSLHDVALPWGEIGPVGPVDDLHRWFLFRPPFFGFNFAFFRQRSANFVVDRTHVLEPPAGIVGHEVTMDIDVVDDFDYALGQVDTQIAFGFEAPTAGRVEVLIDAQCLRGEHNLTTENRWGWSDSLTSQINYLMLDVLHPDVPEPSLAEMSRFSRETAGDTYDHVKHLTRGQHYFAQLLSAGPVPAGHCVVVVGTRSFDKSGANDVEIHSRSNFEWLISSVEVRIAP